MGAVLIHLSVVLLNVKLRVAGGGAGELAQIRDDRRSRSRLLESQRPEKRRSSPRVRASGVFAPLVGALVFKTSGGFDKSSQWVRFPYTPAPRTVVRDQRSDVRDQFSVRLELISDL